MCNQSMVFNRAQTQSLRHTVVPSLLQVTAPVYLMQPFSFIRSLVRSLVRLIEACARRRSREFVVIVSHTGLRSDSPAMIS